MVSPAVVVKILKAVSDRATWERQQYSDHLGDDYQKGRALATEQTLEAILHVIRED